MFKRTISAVTILMAILFLTFGGVEAANPAQNPDAASEFDYTATDAGSIGNGNGSPGGFHDPDWNIKPIPSSQETYEPEPVKPKPVKPETLKPEPVKPKPVKPEPVRRDTPKPQPTIKPAVEKSDEWLIYWYVCGTDIESNRTPGDVTRCIREVESADLSSGKVKIFMQAGGTSNWKHPNFVQNNGKVGRYLYDANKQWQQLEPLTSITTGDPKTLMSTYEGLKDFLERGKQFEQENYNDPSKIHRVFIFVDHGGGSLEGLCSDEYAGGDKLNLSEMRRAFSEVWKTSPATTMNNPPFDVVAFDTCLMGTYETAVSLEGISNYMVGSQECIYGTVMFEYNGLLSQLSQTSSMSPEDFGRVICDTYRQDAINQRQFSNTDYEYLVTMALIDLNKMPAVDAAYDKFGQAALRYCQKEYKGSTPHGFIAYLDGAARNAESYPCAALLEQIGQAYPDMIDLKDFAAKTKMARGFSTSANLQNASDELIAAIENAVVHNVRGGNFQYGGGLSTFYPYGLKSGNIRNFSSLAKSEMASKAQSALYDYMLSKGLQSGRLNSSASGSQVNSSGDVNATNPSQPQGMVSDLSYLGFQKIYVDVDDEKNTFSVTLNQEQMDSISAVRAQLVWFETSTNDQGDKNSAMLFLGGDTGIEADWNAGEFKSTFDGKWLMIENRLVFVYVSSENTEIDENGIKRGSEMYAIPISLNGRHCNLMVACSYPDETFRIIGARPEINGGVPTGEIYGIKKGDVVKPLFLGFALSEEDVEKLNEKYPDPNDLTDEEKVAIAKELAEAGKLGLVEGSEFTIGETVTIERRPLPDGKYAYAFQFVNPFGGLDANSNLNAVFAMRKGEIAVVADADFIDDPSELDEMADSKN